MGVLFEAAGVMPAAQGRLDSPQHRFDGEYRGELGGGAGDVWFAQHSRSSGGSAATQSAGDPKGDQTVKQLSLPRTIARYAPHS